MRVFERPGIVDDPISLGLSPLNSDFIAGAVDFALGLSFGEVPEFAFEDPEPVVDKGVAAGVTLSSDRGTEEDEILVE